MSIKVDANSFGVEVQVLSFSIYHLLMISSTSKMRLNGAVLLTGWRLLLLILLYYWITTTSLQTIASCSLMVSLKGLLALLAIALSTLIFWLVQLDLLLLSWPLPLTVILTYTPRAPSGGQTQI